MDARNCSVEDKRESRRQKERAKRLLETAERRETCLKIRRYAYRKRRQDAETGEERDEP